MTSLARTSGSMWLEAVASRKLSSRVTSSACDDSTCARMAQIALTSSLDSQSLTMAASLTAAEVHELLQDNRWVEICFGEIP